MHLSSNVLWVGIGCKRGTSAELMCYAFEIVCRDYDLNRDAIAGIGTLKGKETEAGLLAFCHGQQWPISFLSARDLRRCPGTHKSSRAEAAVGTPSVAEAAAILLGKQNGNGVASILIVPKQCFQWPQESGAVTLAIAQTISQHCSGSTSI
jgi:cobalamin biosynthesis protein CbiG